MIVEINTVNYGSTGTIMMSIQACAKLKGLDVKTYYGEGKVSDLEDCYKIGNNFYNSISSKLAHLTGFFGCFAFFSTLRLIGEFKKNKVSIIHLHNLHISFLNLPLLFKYIKRNKIKVIWTLHDCWTFTGHCPHFTLEKCNKWKTGCYKCTQYKKYPVTTFDNSRFMWKLKKKWFTNVEDMILITPSLWLADLVKQSFLKKYSVKVINNGINLDIFHPTENNFREKYHLENKYIILGVAFQWGKSKGLDVFIDLASRLDDKFQIILIGTNDSIDKMLPESVISIHRTESQKEMAEIYTAADLFVNTTREDTYPTVNMESLACGTPVLTFRTGGSPEMLNEKCGYVVDCDDIDELEKQIIRICNDKVFSRDDCLEKAKSFDMNKKFEEYVTLYKERI